MIDRLFELFFLAGLVGYECLFAVHTRRVKRNKIVDDRKAGLEFPVSVLAFVGMQVTPVLYVLTSWLDFADYDLPTWAGWAGAVAFAVALWLVWRSHADLGRNWSASLQVRDGHSLVTQGVYRHIRHPIYAAQWLWCVAQALLLQNWIAGLGGLLSFLPVYLYRVPREEQMMLEHFGDQYRSYMDRTGRVIPRSILGREDPKNSTTA